MTVGFSLPNQARSGFFARRNFLNYCRDDDDEGSHFEEARQGRHRRFASRGIPAKNNNLGAREDLNFRFLGPQPSALDH